MYKNLLWYVNIYNSDDTDDYWDYGTFCIQILNFVTGKYFPRTSKRPDCL